MERFKSIGIGFVLALLVLVAAFVLTLIGKLDLLEGLLFMGLSLAILL